MQQRLVRGCAQIFCGQSAMSSVRSSVRSLLAEAKKDGCVRTAGTAREPSATAEILRAKLGSSCSQRKEELGSQANATGLSHFFSLMFLAGHGHRPWGRRPQDMVLRSKKLRAQGGEGNWVND